MALAGIWSWDRSLIPAMGWFRDGDTLEDPVPLLGTTHREWGRALFFIFALTPFPSILGPFPPCPYRTCLPGNILKALWSQSLMRWGQGW